jgi:hypothetical protein
MELDDAVMDEQFVHLTDCCAARFLLTLLLDVGFLLSFDLSISED